MDENSLLNEPTSDQSDLLVTSLNVSAGIAVAVGVLAAAGVLSQAALGRGLDLETILLSAGWLVAGLTIGVGLWAVCWIVRFLGSRGVGSASQAQPAQSSGLPRIDELAGMTANETVKQQQADRSYELLQRIVDELAELREDISLSPEQRQTRAERRRQEQLAQSLADIQAAISSGQFVLADDRLGHLARTSPDTAELAPMRAGLADARAEAEARKLASARAMIGELMSMAAFGRAISEAQNLVDELPDSDAAVELLTHVRQEADTYARQQRQKLYLQVTRSTEMHNWRSALAGARELVRTYPDSIEAGEAVAQMDLLSENARIEEVRDRRDRIADLLQRRQYSRALELAEDIVAHYSDTQAARELAEQMDRLRDMAAKDKS